MSEIGGDFHWSGMPPGPYLTWPEPHRLFGTGRAAVAQLGQQHPSARVWLPTYFCPDTIAYWRTSGMKIMRYDDHPARSQPNWTTLKAAAGDIVIAVNYFGVRAGEPWHTWRIVHPAVILLEDHTHDPFSTWANQSEADYAFASLRKTLPVPDGALLWSPTRHSLPEEPTGQQWTGSALKLAAMMWKSEYISSGETAVHLKTIFRQFQIAGEENLDQMPDQQISPWSRVLLAAGFPVEWRQRRIENVRQLLDRLSTTDYVSVLFTDWPPGHCPFSVVLITDTVAQRDALRQRFIAAGIYPPIHWELPEDAAAPAVDLSRRVLTIPVDHRCTSKDVDRIATILHNHPSDRL